MKRIFASFVVILTAWSALGQDTAIRYYPTYLGTLNGYPLQATAINNSGQVCGNPAFIYTAGVIQDLSRAPVAELPVSPEGDPPLYFGPAITATSINDEGNVVGYAFEEWSELVDDGGDYFYTGQTGYPAYLYTEGAIYDLGYDISNFTIGLYVSPVYTIPLCISDRDNEIIAGSMYRFGWPADWENTSVIYPLWLNNQGHMAGWLADETGPTNSAGEYIYTHACLANFSPHDLGTLGGSNSLALCLNANDQVVGWSLNNNEVKHAFFWSGAMTDMGTLGGAVNDTSVANFINSSGQVVGISTINSGQTPRAFLYSNGTMVDLNTLIVNGNGVVFTNATAINDSGQIISGSYLLTPFVVVTNVNVQFTTSSTNGSVPLTAQFNCPGVDSGGYTIVSWNWIFGDGSTSSLQNPTHTYTTAGNFTPILLATNVNNSPMLGYGPSSITVTNPVVQFTFSPTKGPAALAVQFNCPGVDSSGNTLVSWQWNFGDGATSTSQNPLHTYTKLGTFNPSLVGMNSYGNAVVGSGASVTVTNSVVHFTASPTNGIAPLAVQFSCPSVDSAGNPITVWRWAFGDGATSTLQNPSHIYTNTANFSPALVTTNNLGNAVIASGPAIAVTNPPAQWNLSESRPPSQNSGVPWSSLAISADGNTLIAADSDRANMPFGPPQSYGLIYLSTNNGASWAQSVSTLNSGYSIGPVAASANGSKLFAGGSEGGILGTTNSGSTWGLVQPLFGTYLSGIQSSADGNELLGATQNGLCLSTNSGNTLSNILALSLPPPISLSPNGSNLFFWYNLNQKFFRSPQTNWWMFTNTSSFNGWIQTSLNATIISALASSYDGSRVVAVGSGVYASTNSGTTWGTNIAPSTNSWSTVASSWDGMRIEIGGAGGLYSSSDGGNTWQSNTSPVTISQICCSSNATTLAGIGSDGAIYVFRNPIIAVPSEAPLSAAVAHGTNFSFSCTLVTGHTYQVQSSPALNSANWQNVGASFPATNSSMAISDAITNSARFYRVKLVQ